VNLQLEAFSLDSRHWTACSAPLVKSQRLPRLSARLEIPHTLRSPPWATNIS